jgi:hypothetical protein
MSNTIDRLAVKFPQIHIIGPPAAQNLHTLGFFLNKGHSRQKFGVGALSRAGDSRAARSGLGRTDAWALGIQRQDGGPAGVRTEVTAAASGG